MAVIINKLLNLFRKLNNIVNPKQSLFRTKNELISIKEYSNDLIYQHLMTDKPVMIARLGSNELLCMTNYIGVTNCKYHKQYRSFIKGQTPPWWWEKKMMDQMCRVAGLFPENSQAMARFAQIMIDDLPSTDILGSWLMSEELFKRELSAAKQVTLGDLDPFFTKNPWTRALKGKKVLVVHPFAETIQKQYEKRDLLFDNGLLPEFQLTTIKAVQSYANNKTEFIDWFAALEYLKNKIAEVDFDVCILGCGAYGFPLAAHVKKMGKKSFHLGGVTQLLFGIKGKRWENYIMYPYTNLYNEHWVRPSTDETPGQVKMVENGCYW